MPEPTLLERLTAYVKPGAHSVSSGDEAYLQDCLAQATSLVDNYAGVTYVEVSSPVEVQHPEEVIYTNDFSTSAKFNEWTAIQGSKIHSNQTLTGDGLHWFTRTFAGLQVGREYTFTVNAVVSVNTATAVRVGMTDVSSVEDIAAGAEFPATNVAYSFTATSTSHELFVRTLNQINIAFRQVRWDNMVLTALDWTEVVGELVKERVSVVPDSVLERAYIEVASELYNRQSAPNGISQFSSPDGSAPVRIARDPMVAARPILQPFMGGGFA